MDSVQSIGHHHEVLDNVRGRGNSAEEAEGSDEPFEVADRVIIAQANCGHGGEGKVSEQYGVVIPGLLGQFKFFDEVAGIFISREFTVNVPQHPEYVAAA